jgi:hypothetical protein
MPRDRHYRLILCPKHRPHVGLCWPALIPGLVGPALDPVATRANVSAVVADTANKLAMRRRIAQAPAL